LKRDFLLLCFLTVACFHSAHAQNQKWLRWELTGAIQEKEELYFRDSLVLSNFVKSKYQELYQAGYLVPREHAVRHSADSLWLRVDAGERFSWLELGMGNVDPVLLVKAGIDLRRFSNKAVDYRQVARMMEALISESENRGYPFAAVRLDSLRRSGNEFRASLNLDEGPYISFDSLKVTGDSRIKPKFLSNFLQIRYGEPFSQKKVTEGISQIKTLPYLRWDGAPELSFQNEQATLYLPLTDRKINSIDGIIGFLPNELDGNKLLVTGQVDIALYNVGGRGRNYELHWQRFNQQSQSLLVSGWEPLLLGTPIDMGLSFSLLKEDTTFLNRDFRLEFGSRILKDGYLKVFTRRQAGDLLAVNGLENLTELPKSGDFRFNNFGLNYRHLLLDDIFFPRRGMSVGLEFSIGNKNILQNTAIPPELYAGIALKTLQYYLTAKIEKHFYIRPQWGIWTRLAGGFVENQNLFLNDLFRLGGLKTVRGFNENFFFASRYLYLNVEPRFYFDTYSYFMIFADLGSFDNAVLSLPRDDTFSAGMGLSLETGNGVFNFVYGLGRSNTQDFAFSLSKIHFGYTGRF
jgi:outer membrane protein assembly factor BamA